MTALWVRGRSESGYKGLYPYCPLYPAAACPADERAGASGSFAGQGDGLTGEYGGIRERMSFRISAAARTHVGRIRTNNEDNFYLQKHIRRDVNQGSAFCGGTWKDRSFLAAVADGMGGEDSGEIASLLAVQALSPCRFEEMEGTARASIDRANEKICEEIEKNGGRRMGSTLAALYIDDGKARCCNIGDSRVYLLREGKFTRLSTDHNKAGRMVELGVLTPEQAARHPSRHELTQHLGIFEEEMVLGPAFGEPVTLHEGDVFLLCSDGLTDMVSEAAIAACLSREAPPEEQTESLVQLALDGGGRDNVTALVIQINEARPSLWQRFLTGVSG